MDSISNDALIEAARAVLSPHTVGGYGTGRGRRMGHVGSALVSSAGNVYSGVCIDTGCGTGFCAEHAAIAAMVTGREYQIAKIVAVYRDEESALFVLPPCGRCRLFISQIDPGNLDNQGGAQPDKLARAPRAAALHGLARATELTRFSG